MKNKEVKTCGNCNHYARHYVILHGVDLEPANCGTCNRIEDEEIHKKPQEPACKYWEKYFDEVPMGSLLRYVSIEEQIHSLDLILRSRNVVPNLDKP